MKSAMGETFIMMRNKCLSLLVIFSIYLSFPAPALASEHSSYKQFTHALRMGAMVAKKVLKLGAALYGAYWITRSILGHCTIRTSSSIVLPADPDPQAKNPLKRLEVYTDGMVVVKPSPNNTIKVIHEFGATERSALAQIKFRSNLIGQTLTIEGLLGSYQQSLFERLVAQFFRIKPKRMLRTIIEIPATTPVDITVGRSDRYVPEGEPTVDIDTLLANITIHAYEGDVCTRNTLKNATLEHVSNPRASYCLGFAIPRIFTEIHTRGTIKASNFIGTLHAFSPLLEYTRHEQNEGPVVHNGQEHARLNKFPNVTEIKG